MKHLWGVDRLLKNADFLKSGTDKDITTVLCSETAIAEKNLLKKDHKSSKNNKKITCLQRLCKYLCC